MVVVVVGCWLLVGCWVGGGGGCRSRQGYLRDWDVFVRRIPLKWVLEGREGYLQDWQRKEKERKGNGRKEGV